MGGKKISDKTLVIENLIENYIPNYRKYFDFNSKETNKIYIVDKITEEIKNEKDIYQA